MKYSFWKGVNKAAINVVLVGGPLILALLPQEWMNLTLGGVLLLGLNYLKVRYAK